MGHLRPRFMRQNPKNFYGGDHPAKSRHGTVRVWACRISILSLHVFKICKDARLSQSWYTRKIQKHDKKPQLIYIWTGPAVTSGCCRLCLCLKKIFIQVSLALWQTVDTAAPAELQLHQSPQSCATRTSRCCKWLCLEIGVSSPIMVI